MLWCYSAFECLNHLTPEHLNTATLEHIGIVARDPETVARLFEKLLGTRCYKEETVEEQGVRTHFLSAGTAKLELLEALSPDSPVARFLEKRGEGVHHLAFETNDIEATFERVQGLGFTPLSDAPRLGADGKRIFFLHPKETHGVLVEFCQYIPTPLEARRIPYHDGHLAVYEMGARSQPTLLVLHGAAGCTQLETEALARRLEPHFHVLALDFSGHGASSDIDNPFSASLFSDNARAVLDHIGIGEAHLFGFSMGGAIALHFAREYPEHVRRLAVHGTTVAWTEGLVEAMTARLDAEIFRQRDTADLEAAHGDWERLFERTARFIRTLPERTAEMEATARKVKAPTLISAADRDDLFPLEAPLHLHRLLPEGRLALLPAMEHALSALPLDSYVPLLLQHFGAHA